MTDELWTLQEVARFLRISPSSVYGWAKQGTIPAVKIGKKWRFSKRDIRRWMAHRQTGTMTHSRASVSERTTTVTA